MAAQKRAAKEPLLSSLARKLGHVAGTLTHVAQGLTQPSSTAGSAAEHMRVKKPAAVVGKTVDSGRPKKARSRKRLSPKIAVTAVAKKAARRTAPASQQKRATRRPLGNRTQR